MQFDPNNPIVKLCASGMEMEGLGNNEEASMLFRKAWKEACNDLEKFIAAHYVARHQESIVDKLKWDEIALELALKINNGFAKGALPSLYLNVGKCYEDMNNVDKAKENYHTALSFVEFLSDDGYGNLIKRGILNGLERVSNIK